jgi:hypothetical protein
MRSGGQPRSPAATRSSVGPAVEAALRNWVSGSRLSAAARFSGAKPEASSMRSSSAYASAGAVG